MELSITAVIVHEKPRDRDMNGILIEGVEHPKQKIAFSRLHLNDSRAF